MRLNGLTFPARFRATHEAGRNYRHYIEASIRLAVMTHTRTMRDAIGEALGEIVARQRGELVTESARLHRVANEISPELEARIKSLENAVDDHYEEVTQRLDALEASAKDRTTLVFDGNTPPFDLLRGGSITNLLKK